MSLSRHSRPRKLLGALTLPAALLCVGYVAFARWQRPAPREETGVRGPAVTRERAAERTSAMKPAAAPAAAAPSVREPRTRDARAVVTAALPRSPSSPAESSAPRMPPTESRLGSDAALAAVQDEPSSPAEGDASPRAGGPISPAGVRFAGGLTGARNRAAAAQPTSATASTPVPATNGGGRGSSSQIPHSNTRVWMAPRTAELRVGDAIALKVQIAQGVDVGSVPFHLLFNPGVLRFERAEEGTFLKGSGRETVFLVAPAASGSELVVGLSSLGSGGGVPGDGLLCVLDFTVIGTGDADLAFSRASVIDSRSQVAPSRFEVASITAR